MLKCSQGSLPLEAVDEVAEPEPDRGEMDEAEIAVGGFVVAGREAA